MLLAPPPVLTTDARRSRDEEQAGAELASLLSDSGPHATLHELLGEARGRRQTLVALVDAPEPAVRALPWELLGAPTPLEGRGDAVIARLVAGRPHVAAPEGDAFTVVLVSPDPTDAVCAARIEELEGWLAAHGIPCTRSTALPAGPAVLHLVAHGRIEDAEGQILASEGSLGPGSAAHGLAPLLAAVQLVVLDVCDAGNTATPEPNAPGVRLVDAGAPAVVAPSTRLGVEAARSFAHGLYTALSEGHSVAESVAAGRREVRGLGRPHPDSRWANPVLHVTSASAAGQRLQRASWRPEGWGPQPPAVSALLDRARTAAGPHGFVGLEHVLAAWPAEGGGAWASHVRYLLAHQPDPRQRLGALRPKTGRDGDFRGTARLRSLQPAVADLEGFARLLWDGLDGAVQALLGLAEGAASDLATSGTTLDPGGPEPGGPGGVATGLEVLGGPEDGRRYGPGSVIGRASPGQDGLYGDTLLVDPYLSRSALEWSGGPTLLKPAKRLAGDAWEPIGTGPVALEIGDQLALTPATVVRAR
ncbi:MAG: CHAT domain-containing protein [Myxococcota bacterium]